MTLRQIRDRLNGLVTGHVNDLDLLHLLEDTIDAGGGVLIEADGSRYRLVRREGRFEIRKIGGSTLPPAR